MAVGQNLVSLVNIKIAGKWMFIPLKMVLIGIDSQPYKQIYDLMYGKNECFFWEYIYNIAIFYIAFMG